MKLSELQKKKSESEEEIDDESFRTEGHQPRYLTKESDDTDTQINLGRTTDRVYLDEEGKYNDSAQSIESIVDLEEFEPDEKPSTSKRKSKRFTTGCISHMFIGCYTKCGCLLLILSLIIVAVVYELNF